jgi:glycosylphosphatidylinositol transamidase
MYAEGLNGRLPNQDLMNSLNIVSTYTGGVPVLLYDHQDEDTYSMIPSWIPQSLRDMAEVRDYAQRARNIIRHVQYQVFGRASGIHGLFHR